MGAPESLIAHVDQVIEYFNKRKLDLPDGFFDRKSPAIRSLMVFLALQSAGEMTGAGVSIGVIGVGGTADAGRVGSFIVGDGCGAGGSI